MNEAERLECLRGLALDAVKQPGSFNKITQLAADICDTSVALLSVVEAGVVWYLGQTGLSLAGCSRSSSICAHCVETGERLLIQDAKEDERFREHHMVTGRPHLRSYLGVPIRAENGALLGTLCVLASRPDAFSQSQISQIEALGDLAQQSIMAHARAQQLCQANASLSHFNRLFRQAETAANIGCWRVDLKTDKLEWSDQVYTIHGLPTDAKVDVTNAIDFYAPEDRPVVQQALLEALDANKPFNFEASITRGDGQARRVRSVGERIDVDGEPDSVAGIFLDCTEEHLRNAALKRAAERDRLTGLYNRSVFDKRLYEAFHGQSRSPVVMMLLDLDGFKEVNDRLGHLVGDKVLEVVAQKLNHATSDEIFLARWGGDEFAFLFKPGTTLDDAIAFGNELVREFEDFAPVEDEPITVGATCGIALLEAGRSNEELVRRADLALYRGKADGRGTVRCWSEAIEEKQGLRQKAIARLKTALCQDATFAAFQPIVDLSNGEIIAMEALLRIREPDNRVVTAAEIFPALLDPQLSRRVSQKMLAQVFDQGGEILNALGQQCRIGINISEADLRDCNLVQRIIDLAGASLLSPSNITIEVTETMLLLDDNGEICECLQRLDALGCTIALDDFGTGFSSLTHLRDFPITLVKIDRDFIAGISGDHQSRLIIQAIVQMGQSLGVKTVAEGVETQEQVDYLRSIQCDCAQGYFFGRPAPLEYFAEEARLEPQQALRGVA